MLNESARALLAATSNDAIAREVLRRWESDEPGTSKPNARSVGAKVGLLRKGDATWWRNQPGALRAVAEFLACGADDLVESTGTGSGEQRFQDFPALRPLAVGEAPCRVGAEGSLVDVVGRCLREVRPTWIVVPPGWGKSLTVRAWRGRERERVAAERCTVLLDFARNQQGRPDAPAVFEVERPDPPTDSAALTEIAQRGAPAIVLAAFELPADAPASWEVVQWKIDPSWRERFVHWCVGRLGEPGQLDPRDFCEWLGIVDASGEGIDSPGALLPLLAWAHAHGTPTEGTLVDVATALVRERLVRGGHSGALADTGAELVRHLALGAIDRHVDGECPLTVAEWRALLPEQPVRGAPLELVQTELDALHRAGSRADKDRHKAALEGLLRRDARDDVIDALLGCELLAVDAAGPDVYPRWLMNAYQQDVIDAATTEQSWEQWGRWAAHPDFRDAVVDSLVAMDRQLLLRTATRVLASDDRSLAHDAAIEALFEAAAYRLDPDAPGHTPWKPTDAQLRVLQRLGAAQADLVAFAMRSRDSHEPSRMTAPPDLWSTAGITWLARAWNYSLVVPAPERTPPAVTWAFPAWATEFHGPMHLPQPDMATDSPDDRLGACLSLLQGARRLVKLKPEILDAQAWAPQVAALLEGVSLRAPLIEEVWLGNASFVLAGVVGTESDEVRSRATAALWSQLDHSLGNPLGALTSVLAPAVRKLLRDNLPAEFLVAKLDPTATVQSLVFQFMVDEFAALPVHLREALFARIATTLVASPVLSLVHIEDAIADLDAFDTLATLAAGKGLLGDAAAERGWSLDADRALVELERSLASDGAAAEAWLGKCPVEHARSVTESVLRARPQPDAAVYRWLAKQVATGSKHAPGLYDLLVGLDGSTP